MNTLSVRYLRWALLFCVVTAAMFTMAATIHRETGGDDSRVVGQPQILQEVPKTNIMPQDTSKLTPSLDSPSVAPDPDKGVADEVLPTGGEDPLHSP